MRYFTPRRATWCSLLVRLLLLIFCQCRSCADGPSFSTVNQVALQLKGMPRVAIVDYVHVPLLLRTRWAVHRLNVPTLLVWSPRGRVHALVGMQYVAYKTALGQHVVSKGPRALVGQVRSTIMKLHSDVQRNQDREDL